MKVIIALLCILSPCLNFASEQPISLLPNFEDVSLKYLSNAFGVMDGVLYGTGSQILGHMSRIFNTLLFCVVGVAWSYTAFVGILNTASEGQFLGQRGSSLWGPLRVIVGTVLLMPKASTGYSLIQIIVMYVVIQGIGAANQVWNVTLNYLERSGATVEISRPMGTLAQPQEDRRANKEYLIDVAGTILKAEFCTLALAKAMNPQKNHSNVSITSTNYLSVPESLENHTKISRIYFPGEAIGRARQPLDKYKGLCGYVEWTKPKPIFGYPNVIGDPIGLSTQSMIYDLKAIAQQTVTQWLDSTPQSDAPHVFLAKKNIPNLRQGALVNASSNFYALVKNYLRAQDVQSQLKIRKAIPKAEFEAMRQQGWIMAGSYYFRVAAINKVVGGMGNPLLPQKIIRAYLGNIKAIQKKLGKKTQQKSFEECLQGIDDYIEREKNLAISIDQKYFKDQETNQAIVSEWAAHLKDGDYRLFYPFQKNLQLFQALMQNTMQQEVDPLVSLSKIGNGLLRAVKDAWSESNWHNIKDNTTKNEALAYPLTLIWMVLNFTLGATLTYYVPLVPFVIFFFGSLTWFILIVTFVVVAPLIALGMIGAPGNQQSSEPFPKLEAAVMPLLSLFLRPMLMVFGLITSMIVCTFAFNLFHYGYHTILPSLTKLEEGGWFALFGHTTMMVVYTSIALSIVNRSFGLIYEIPNTALRFIGGAVEGHSESEPLMQVKSGIERYAGDVGHQTGPKSR